jgi:hypothetical protein
LSKSECGGVSDSAIVKPRGYGVTCVSRRSSLQHFSFQGVTNGSNIWRVDLSAIFRSQFGGNILLAATIPHGVFWLGQHRHSVIHPADITNSDSVASIAYVSDPRRVIAMGLRTDGRRYCELAFVPTLEVCSRGRVVRSGWVAARPLEAMAGVRTAPRLRRLMVTGGVIMLLASFVSGSCLQRLSFRFTSPRHRGSGTITGVQFNPG